MDSRRGVCLWHPGPKAPVLSRAASLTSQRDPVEGGGSDRRWTRLVRKRARPAGSRFDDLGLGNDQGNRGCCHDRDSEQHETEVRGAGVVIQQAKAAADGRDDQDDGQCVTKHAHQDGGGATGMPG